MIRKVTLIFPSVSLLADFVLLFELSGETNVKERTYRGDLDEDLLVAACTRYSAELLPVIV